MFSKLARELVRWTVIVSSSGLALYLFGGQIAWGFRSEPGRLAGYVGVLLTVVLMCAPLLVTAHGCWKRDYASVIEVWSMVVGILVCGALFQAVHYFDPLKWIKGVFTPSAAPAPWMILGSVAGLVAVFLVLLSPFLLGRATYRFCRRLGYRYFPSRPPQWLRHVG